MKLQTQEMKLDFQEKDMINDLLETQKKASSDYNTFASETVDKFLKADVLDILRDEHESESMIFEEMNARGWYKVKAAETQEIQSAKTKFNQLDKQYGL